jgi:long-chain acyl-CoA synthetase
MFAGYFNHPADTAGAFHDGWYVTGDLGKQDERGRLYLTGRKPILINVGGKKVNPLEVEEVLLSHPQVRDVVVFASDIDSGSQSVCASVVVEGPVTKDSLVAFCRSRLAPFKVPRAISFLTDLPRTSLGKMRRPPVVPDTSI